MILPDFSVRPWYWRTRVPRYRVTRVLTRDPSAFKFSRWDVQRLLGTDDDFYEVRGRRAARPLFGVILRRRGRYLACVLPWGDFSGVQSFAHRSDAAQWIAWMHADISEAGPRPYQFVVTLRGLPPDRKVRPQVAAPGTCLVDQTSAQTFQLVLHGPVRRWVSVGTGGP